jgi:peptidoglycan/LPS O-acetylase OafA/YrhL
LIRLSRILLLLRLAVALGNRVVLPPPHKVQLKGLNGLRAIAALAVVVMHTGIGLQPFGLPWNRLVNELGVFAVTIFFSLSGFLITYLLLLEKDDRGDVNAKDFYIRRILRIWPLYFLYLSICVLVISATKTQPLPGSLPYYLLLAANIPFIWDRTPALRLVAHYWSLGVEEQFYLSWPWVARKEKLERIIGVFLVLFFGLKIATRAYWTYSGHNTPYRALDVTRFDCMAIGGIGAVWFHRRSPAFWKTCTSLVAQVVAWGGLVALAFNQFHIHAIIDDEIVSVLTVVLIVNVSSNPHTIVNLEWRLSNYLGKISYGIYVIHPLVIFGMQRWCGAWISQLAPTLRYTLVYVGVMALTIGLAATSYEFYERRFLNLKDRFSTVKSSSG